MSNKCYPNVFKSTFIPFESESVTGYSVSIIGHRETQEDEEIMFETDLKGHYVYGIFDGHGGFETSKYLKRHFKNFFLGHILWREYKELYKDGSIVEFDFEKLFTTIFVELDQKMKPFIMSKRSRKEASGSTAVIVLQTPTKYVCATVGDSEAWILKSDGVVKLSIVKKPDDVDEKARIEALGGTVVRGYINSMLGVSRAFGDFDYKCSRVKIGKYGYPICDFNIDPKDMIVTVVPFVSIFDRVDCQGTLLLACDGFFDVINGKDLPETHIQNLLVDFEKYNVNIRKTLTALDNFSFSLHEVSSSDNDSDNDSESEIYKLKKSGGAGYFIKKEDESKIDTDPEKVREEIFEGFVPSIENIPEPEELNSILMKKYLVDTLARYALAKGSTDNISVMLITDN